MLKRNAAHVLALAALLAAGLAHAETYRWLDADGRVHYSDSPPPRTAQQVERKHLTGNVVQGDALSYSEQLATKNFPVTLYTAANCGAPCDDGRKLLAGRGVSYKEVQVIDEASRAALKAASGSDGVPVLTVGRDARQGYEQSAWHAALDAAGYPRSGARNAARRNAPPAKAAAEKAPASEAEAQPAPGPYTPRF